MIMKKYLLLIIVGAGIYFPASAQNKKAKYKFSSVNNFIFTGGNNSLAGALQSMNGIKKDKWFAGVGVGLDFYLYRSVPISVGASREFGNKKNKFFAYGNMGINVPWLAEEYHLKPNTWDPNRRNEFHNGLYTDAGLGYSFGLKNDQAIQLAIGHSLKTFSEERWFSDWRSPTPLKDTYKYTFSRIVLKVGWKL